MSDLLREFEKTVDELTELIKRQNQAVSYWDTAEVERLIPLIEQKSHHLAKLWNDPQLRERVAHSEGIVMKLTLFLEALDSNLYMLSSALKFYRDFFKTLEGGVSTYDNRGKVK